MKNLVQTEVERILNIHQGKNIVGILPPTGTSLDQQVQADNPIRVLYFKQSVSENDFSTVTTISGTSRIRVTLSNDGSLLEVETEKLDEGLEYRDADQVEYGEGGHGERAHYHTAYGSDHNLRGAESGNGSTASAKDITKGSLGPYSSNRGIRQKIHASLPNLQYGCNGATCASTGSSCTCSCSSLDSEDINSKDEIKRRPHSMKERKICPIASAHLHHSPEHHYYHTIRPYSQGSCVRQSGREREHTAYRHKTNVPFTSGTVASTSEEIPDEATKGIFNSQRTSIRKAKQSSVSIRSSNNNSCQATQALCVCCSGTSQSPPGPDPSALRKRYDVSSVDTTVHTVLSDAATSKATHVDVRINSYSRRENYTNGCSCQTLCPPTIHENHECYCKCHGATINSSSPNSVTSQSSDLKYQTLVSNEDGLEKSCRANGAEYPPTSTHHSRYRNTTTYCHYGTDRRYHGDSDINQAHERLLGKNGEDLEINQNQKKPVLQLDYYHHSTSAAETNRKGKGEGIEDFASKFQACQSETNCRSCTCGQCTSLYPLCVPIDIQRPSVGKIQGHINHTNNSTGPNSSYLGDSCQRHCNDSCNNCHCSAVSPLSEAGTLGRSCSTDCQPQYTAIDTEKSYDYHNPRTCKSCLRSLNKMSCQPEEECCNNCDPDHCNIFFPTIAITCLKIITYKILLPPSRKINYRQT